MSVEPEIFNIAKRSWLVDEFKFDEDVILNIYNDQIIRHGFSHNQIQALDFTQYFERYLWPNFEANRYKCERQYVISICAIINEKLSKKVIPWEAITTKPEQFSAFLQKVLEMIIDATECSKQKWLEKIVLIQFLNNCLLSMTDVDLIFNEIKYLLSLGMWTCLSTNRLTDELSKHADYKHKYNKLVKIDAKTEEKIRFKRIFLSKLLYYFLSVIESAATEETLIVRFAENCVLLFINLESVLVSRRYLNSVIDDKHIIVHAQKCALLQQHSDDSRLFKQLIEMLDHYAHFEIDEATGSTLTDVQLEARHRTKLVAMQKMAFCRFKEPMRQLWLSDCRKLEEGDNLRGILSEQSIKDLRSMASSLGLVNEREIHEKEDLIDINKTLVPITMHEDTVVVDDELNLEPQDQQGHQPKQQQQQEEAASLSFDNEVVTELIVTKDELMRDITISNIEATKNHIQNAHKKLKVQNDRIIQLEKANADFKLNQQIKKEQWAEQLRELNKKHEDEVLQKTTEICRKADEWGIREDQLLVKGAEYQQKEDQPRLKKFATIEEVIEISTEDLKRRIENWIHLEEESILNTPCDVEFDMDLDPSTSGKTRLVFAGLNLTMPTPLRKRKPTD